MCHPPYSLQAAAEPVTVGSVHTPLHSAWRPPARGLTFPEVLSHSASCYSLWQVRPHLSGRQQTWSEASRRGLFSHKSLIYPAGGAEISRCLQKIVQAVNHAFGSACCPWCQSGVRSGVRAERGIGWWRWRASQWQLCGVSGQIAQNQTSWMIFLGAVVESDTSSLPHGKNRSLIHLSFCTKCSRNTPWRSLWSSAHAFCHLQSYWSVYGKGHSAAGQSVHSVSEGGLYRGVQSWMPSTVHYSCNL